MVDEILHDKIIRENYEQAAGISNTRRKKER
jgi:hypothetical protein